MPLKTFDGWAFTGRSAWFYQCVNERFTVGIVLHSIVVVYFAWSSCDVRCVGSASQPHAALKKLRMGEDDSLLTSLLAAVQEFQLEKL